MGLFLRALCGPDLTGGGGGWAWVLAEDGGLLVSVVGPCEEVSTSLSPRGLTIASGLFTTGCRNLGFCFSFLCGERGEACYQGWGAGRGEVVHARQSIGCLNTATKGFMLGSGTPL